MSYTPTTWATGDTITASAMNKIENGIANAGSGWDAVIRLTHSDNSGADTTSNLTPSIVSGTYSNLYTKLSSGGFLIILVEYYHPWGTAFSSPMGYVLGGDEYGITITVAGFSPFGSTGSTVASRVYGNLLWSSNDTISWS